MIRFFVQLGTNSPQRTSNEKGIAFVQILIISVTLVVVAVPEGKHTYPCPTPRNIDLTLPPQVSHSLSPSHSRSPRSA